MNKIIDIELDKLEIHPKNVRKEYEGIEELAQSIKENGIMQNLTVVPDPEHKDKYLVVIGNRRLTAAKQAGIKTAPCIIAENMEEREQISTMLTENINRKDLKVYEEAAAMQMCFSDYGFGIEELENKTGLSKTTINHRLNIAKLDSKLLQKKTNDEEFQLSFKDLYALEKVKDIKTRNSILKEARDSKEIVWRAKRAAQDEVQNEHILVFKKMLKDKKIRQADEKTALELYTKKWHEVKRYDLDDKPPAKIVIPSKSDTSKMVYTNKYGWLTIYEPNTKENQENRIKTKKEIEQEERDRKILKIKEITKNIIKDMREYVASYFEGKLDCRLSSIEREDLDCKLWEIFKRIRWISVDNMIGAYAGPKWNTTKMTVEELTAARENALKLNVLDQKLAAAFGELTTSNICLVSWEGRYVTTQGETLKMYHDVLTSFGYCYLDDEMAKVADGTHELYVQEVQK